MKSIGLILFVIAPDLSYVKILQQTMLGQDRILDSLYTMFEILWER